MGPFVGIFLFCYTVFPLSFAAGACLNYVLRIPRSPTCAALNVDAFGAVAVDSISINSFPSHSRSQMVSGPHHVDPGCASDTIDMRFGFHYVCLPGCLPRTFAAFCLWFDVRSFAEMGYDFSQDEE